MCAIPNSSPERVAVGPRHGIAAGGNWIVDRVKTVDQLPGRGMLANIRAVVLSSGGAPANVLADLARMRVPFPLAGYGLIGCDADGDFIESRFRALGIDISGLQRRESAPTSYTDVMTEVASGARTFFHHRGANADFGPEHVPLTGMTCRLFHLGYVLLLDRMDSPDPELGTQAARLLRDLRARGIRTSLDVVSEEGDRFRALVPPALKHTDYLIINEIEAGRVTGLTIRRPEGTFDAAALVAAVDALMAMGDMELTVIHMPEGAYLKHRASGTASAGSLRLPPGFIKGAVGAGDAFCAGVLYGIHEGWSPEAILRLGNCSAAAALSQAGATEGLLPVAELLALAEQFGTHQPLVA